MNLKNSKIKCLTDHRVTPRVRVIQAGILLFALSAYLSQSTLVKELLTESDSLLGTAAQSHSTIASVSVGQYRFSLNGYTSPQARVILEGQGIYEETHSDEDGYFEFANEFSPFTQREACITAIDTDGRASTPLCLPPFPINKDVVIGPIILPPTLTLNQDIYAREDFGISTGKGVPNSTITIDLASPDKDYPVIISTTTTTDGSFSITLPTSTERNYSITSRNIFDTHQSTKSNALSFDVLPLWKRILGEIKRLSTLLGPFSLPIILMIEVCILLGVYALYKRRSDQAEKSQRHHLQSS